MICIPVDGFGYAVRLLFDCISCIYETALSMTTSACGVSHALLASRFSNVAFKTALKRSTACTHSDTMNDGPC